MAENANSNSSYNIDVLASRIFDQNPRIPIVVNNKPVALLRLTPASNIKGSLDNPEIGIAIELVINDINALSQRIRQTPDGKYVLSLRVFDTNQANAFFTKCITYTWQVHLLNVTAASLAEIRQRYQQLKAQQQQQPTQQKPVFLLPMTQTTIQQQSKVETDETITEQ